MSTTQSMKYTTFDRGVMRELRRSEIFGEVIEGFLRSLRRMEREDFERVEERLVKQYLKEEKGGCFSDVKPSEVKRTLEQMAEDLLWLVERFEGNVAVEEMKSYRLMVRVLEEQCKVVGSEREEKRVKVKKPKEVASDSLQNTSDPDVTYDGRKGQRYQVQIMETYQEVEEGEEKEKTKPDLITHVDVEPACKSDTEGLPRAIEATQERECGPSNVLADGGYGGDEDVEKAAKEGVEVVSPANKGSGASEERLSLDDFQFDEETGEISECPAGERPIKTGQTPRGYFTASFDRDRCCACGFRDGCPVRVGTHTATLKPYSAKKRRLAQRRAREKGGEFREKYRWRAGVEATMSQYKSQTGAGRLRVRGMPAVRFAAKLKALGLNIFRCAQAAAEAVKTAYSNRHSCNYGLKFTLSASPDCPLHLSAPRTIQNWVQVTRTGFQPLLRLPNAA